MSKRRNEYKKIIPPSPLYKRGVRGDFGFTLMEVLIAIAILAIVMTIVYGSFVQTRKVIGRAEGAVDELRGVRAALHRITSDLSMAFIEEEDDSTFFVGTDDYTSGYPNDSVDFTSFSNRLRNKDAKESDQMEVGYYLKRDFEGRGALMKREKRHIDENPMYGGKTYEISEEIAGLDLRYLDEYGEWQDSWDSRVESPAAIPVAVEITLIVRDNSGAERSYRTIAEIPLGRKS